jgi:hypothetical protein
MASDRAHLVREGKGQHPRIDHARVRVHIDLLAKELVVILAQMHRAVAMAVGVGLLQMHLLKLGRPAVRVRKRDALFPSCAPAYSYPSILTITPVAMKD